MGFKFGLAGPTRSLVLIHLPGGPQTFLEGMCPLLSLWGRAQGWEYDNVLVKTPRWGQLLSATTSCYAKEDQMFTLRHSTCEIPLRHPRGARRGALA